MYYIETISLQVSRNIHLSNQNINDFVIVLNFCPVGPRLIHMLVFMAGECFS